MAKAQTELLPLSGGKLNVSTISELCETPVWRLLNDEGLNAREAAAEIVRSPRLRASLDQIADSVRSMAAKAGDTGVFRALQPLLIMYGRPKKADAEMATWYGLYYDALGKLPMEAITYAVSEYIRTSQIHAVPAPGPLSKLAAPVAEKIWRAAYRVKFASEMSAVRARPEPTPEEKAAVRAMVADFVNGPRPDPADARPRETPQEMAARLRGVHHGAEEMRA